jgi:predicted NAD/FAD-dependent oxidoreductase
LATTGSTPLAANMSGGDSRSVLGDYKQHLAEIDEVVTAISDVFAMAWSAHAKEKRLSKNSKGWWMDTCSHDLATFCASHMDEDWKQYCHTMRAAKRKFFDDQIHEVASSDQRPWDLMSSRW